MESGSESSFVPDDFDPPAGLTAEDFILEPLSLEHNASDLEAWTSSIAHIQSTPGFAGRDWPVAPLTVEENLADLKRHAADFERRSGYTYTVLDSASRQVIGCVYFYPPRRPGFDVDVRSWVRARDARLDAPLYAAITQWLERAWPWRAPDYAPRRP
ncbi:MAG: hypothetical protein JWO62_2756 [Acidimicrobiaceae bacterium]|jgi:hypothetical protein|nr:hypothetical protein [Acidimicrobiaceae bacterium]